MSAALVRGDIGPMVAGYVLVMGALAVGLLLIKRSAGRPSPGRPVADRPRIAVRPEPGWPRLIAHCVATAAGGYLLLMTVIVFYFYAVSPIAGNFVPSAFSGCAALLGLSLPVFLALSWLAERKGWRI
jgi:hypothetical protein